MRINLKWFATGNTSAFEDNDEVLGPQTTVLEVKGLISIRFGFQPKETLLICNGLLENHRTLSSLGITNQETADEVVITAHVVRDAGLAKANTIGGGEADEEEEDDAAIQEFTHEDMILALKMLGKDVPVSDERMAEVRQNAPRARPAFLNTTKREEPPVAQAPASAPPAVVDNAPPLPASAPRVDSDVHRIFRESRYGLRAENAENSYGLMVPGAPEVFQYWDCRLPEDPRHNALCQGTEVCLELFYFGEFKYIRDGENFNALVRHSLELRGYKARTPLAPREAGCMYPLVAVTLLLAEVEASELCKTLFDDFGTAKPSTYGQHNSGGDGAKSGGGGCAQQ